MKHTITTITILFLICFVSSIYPGECDSIEFPNANPVDWYSIENSSSLEGFYYSKSGTTITYCLNDSFIPQSFKIVFYNEEEEIVISSQQSGGGGTRYTKVKEPIINETNITTLQEPVTETTTPLEIKITPPEEESHWKRNLIIITIIIIILGIIIYYTNSRQL